MPATEKPLPPGNFGPPLLGETLAFAKDPFAFLEERFRRHGPVFKTHVLGTPMVCLVGPEAISFFTDELAFERKDASPTNLKQLMHPAALPFLDGDVHLARRRLLEAAFSPEALASYLPVIERIIERHLKTWEARGRLHGSVDIGLMCFTLANTLFAGADPDRDEPELADAFNRFAGGLMALPVNLPFTAYGKAIRARDLLRAYVARAVDGHQEGAQPSVLSRVLATSLPGDEVKIEILHFFLAAFAGIKVTLMNLLVAMDKDRAVQERARAEVREHAGAGPITFDTLHKLAYNDRVSREVRRFYRIFPSTFFGRVKKDVDFGGYRLLAGWKAIAVLHSTMRDAKTFSEPDRFDPERFAPGRAEDEKKVNAFCAHGVGPKGHPCIGRGLAEEIIAVFQARLLRDYAWELPAQDLSYSTSGVPEVRSGLQVAIRRAEVKAAA